MASRRLRIRGSQSDLEALARELKEFGAADAAAAPSPASLTVTKVPRDPDSPLGQIEWYELAFIVVTGAAGNAFYDGIKLIVSQFIKRNPNRASLSEEDAPKPEDPK